MAGAKPGERRGGRAKGTRNKISIATREDLRRYLESIGADPGRTLADLMHKSREAKTRMYCAEALLDRLLPKLKAVEVTGNMEKPVYLSLDRVTPAERQARQARIAALLAKRRGGEEGEDAGER